VSSPETHQYRGGVAAKTDSNERPEATMHRTIYESPFGPLTLTGGAAGSQLTLL
jgi:hypothetical protein